MRILALIVALFMLSGSLMGCFDTLFGDDDDDDDDIPEPVERDVNKEYQPFEVIHEKLGSGWEDAEEPKTIYDHYLLFRVRNIGDSGICKAECRVWAVTTDGSVINAKEEAIYLVFVDRPLYPGDIWDYNSGAGVDFDYPEYEFSALIDATIHYSFTWEKCKADVEYISVTERDVDGKPAALVVIRNTGGVPVHSVTAEISVWHARVSETLAVKLVAFKNGGTLMPGDTAEATAVFEDKAAGFGGIDHFIRVDIRFEEGPGPDANEAEDQ